MAEAKEADEAAGLLDDDCGRSPKETYEELGATALFLRTTTARKAAVLQASRAAKLAEEETARKAVEEKKQQMLLVLREASLAGTFRLRTTLPSGQDGRSDWADMVHRRSVLGLSFDDLMGTDQGDGAAAVAAAAVAAAAAAGGGGPILQESKCADEEKCDGGRFSGEEKREVESKVCQDEGKEDDEYSVRVATLTRQLVRSERKPLSYKDLQETVPHFDDDYMSLFGPKVTDARLRRKVGAFVPPQAEACEDAEFLTDRALLTRERLRDSPRVAALVTLFWLAADHDGANCITREKYLALNRKLQICVLGLHDPGFCSELAARDWELDKDPDTGLLPFARLKLSLFMLADMCVPRLSEEAYCHFLATVAQRILRVDAATKSSLALREDRFVIPRKVFQLVETEFPKWTAFPMPATPRACREMYAQTSWQMEDMVDVERAALAAQRPGRIAKDSHLAKSVSKGLSERRSS